VQDLYYAMLRERNEREIGRERASSALHASIPPHHRTAPDLVLVESESRRAPDEWFGRSDTFKRVFFRKCDVPLVRVGDFAVVRINASTGASLRGVGLRVSSIQEFAIQEFAAGG
jgi:hypothetical protein